MNPGLRYMLHFMPSALDDSFANMIENYASLKNSEKEPFQLAPICWTLIQSRFNL